MMAAAQEKEKSPQKDRLWIPAGPFIDALKEVSFVAPRNNENTSLSRIEIAYGKAGLVLAAADGIRLAATLVTQNQVASDISEGKIHIDAEQLVDALKAIFPGKTRAAVGNFSLEADDNKISICNGFGNISLTRDKRSFPDLQRAVDFMGIATPNEQLDAIVRRKDLLQALRELPTKKNERHNPVFLSYTPNPLDRTELSHRLWLAQNGTSTSISFSQKPQDAAGEREFGEITVKLDRTYLQQLLEHVKTQAFIINANKKEGSGLRPVIFKKPDSPMSFFYAVMPMAHYPPL